MITLETWKRTQKKNEKRRAVARRRIAHRRQLNRIPMADRISRKMVRENERLSKLNPSPLNAPKQKQNVLFNNIMKLFSKRSQRGS